MTQRLVYRKNPDFPNRYISPEKLFFYLQANYSDHIQKVGQSFLDKPIFNLRMGNGKIKVLAWSQMHGNESNSTHCMLDLWYSLELQPESVGALGARQSRSRSVGHRIIHPPWWVRCGMPRQDCSLSHDTAP